ncbi:processing peptidase [Thermodesulfobacterium geofontis OPF15]|uniref:Processing peptidase n=1 Tax=Thermodesulfobacterium geofontis (strain OPF15) TaxID=795359 RepID=F8C3X5_THEGP|nr:pitrilysin family protein [Thermodesulfobacterium geofontis]AEH22513.1 processing peptidase [Thermodesulfobacterium geofontis OPF15]
MENRNQTLELLVSKVKEKKLQNGLTVLFYPYKREDVVTVKLCVKVGSAYEKESEAGITHLIEHMIFKGTETKKPEDIVGVIEALGGYMNAFTSYDYTCYYVAGPSTVAEKALDILSDVVFHPYFDPLELEREKEVVIEEMKMRLDNPFVVLFENLMKASYKKYPYRRPIIGYENTVKSFKREDLLNFLNHFYTPKNMILIVVGNLEENKLFSLINKYFSFLPKRKLKKVIFPKETYTEEPSLIWIERPVKEGYFAFTLPGASFRDEDAPYLDLLSEILGGGESSRLYKRLKRDLNLVKTISASSYTPYGPGLFEIYGTADPQNFKEIIKETLLELEKIKLLGVSSEELNKAKTQILSDFVFSSETSEGLSSTLGSFQLVRGSYKDILWYQKKIETATIEDLIRVSKKYFNPQKLVVSFLSEKKLFDNTELKKIISTFGHNIQLPEIFTLNNNLKVILYPQNDIPSVGVTLAFPGGLRFETKETNGVFQALSLLWTRGTKNYTAEELAEKLESIGTTIKGFTGRNTFGLKMLSLSSKLDESLEYFKEILIYPSFEEKECEKAKPELYSLLLRQQDQPISLAVNEFLKVLFPDHPYGLNSAGSLEFYQKFTCEDLKTIYKKFVRPERGVLVITGNFELTSVKEKIKNLFNDWKSETQETILEEPEPIFPKNLFTRIEKETFQTQILLGFQTPGLNAKEKVALEILNSALSGQNGRLFRILRDEKSLAYSVTSFLIFYPKKSAFVLYIGCSPKKEKSAITGFWEILEEIKTHGLLPEEIERAKNRLIGSLKLELQSNLSISEEMAINEVLGLGWNYSLLYENLVKSVTDEDIKNLIETFFKRENAVLFILGKNENRNHK